MPSEPPRSDRAPASGEEVELGRVVGVFGVRGELRLHLHARDSFLLEGPRVVMLEAADGTRRSVGLRVRPGSGRRILGRIDGIDDRDAAAALVGSRLLVPRSELPAPSGDEFYHFEVVGLPVLVGDEERGRVEAVHETPAGDVLEVRVGRGTVFVPAVRRFVLEIDRARGRVVVSEDALEEP